MKFIAVFIAIGLAALVGVWAGRRITGPTRVDAGVEGNARLTGYAAVLLLLPLGAEIVTGIRQDLQPHALVGFLLVPPVLLKLGSVGYRFVRYYAREPRYRAAGPPELVMRLLAPISVLATVILFATGIELWLFGLGFGEQWRTWHQASFLFWSLVIATHVFGYVPRAAGLAVADSGDHIDGALTRRSLVIGSLIFGLILVVVMLPFSSPFPLAQGG